MDDYNRLKHLKKILEKDTKKEKKKDTIDVITSRTLSNGNEEELKDMLFSVYIAHTKLLKEFKFLDSNFILHKLLSILFIQNKYMYDGTISHNITEREMCKSNKMWKIICNEVGFIYRDN